MFNTTVLPLTPKFRLSPEKKPKRLTTRGFADRTMLPTVGLLDPYGGYVDDSVCRAVSTGAKFRRAVKRRIFGFLQNFSRNGVFVTGRWFRPWVDLALSGDLGIRSC